MTVDIEPKNIAVRRYEEVHVVVGALLRGTPAGVKAEDIEDPGLRAVFVAALETPRLAAEHPEQVDRVLRVAERMGVAEADAASALHDVLGQSFGIGTNTLEQVERSADMVRNRAAEKRANEKVAALVLKYEVERDTVDDTVLAEALLERAAIKKGGIKIQIPSLRGALADAIKEATGPKKGPYGLLPAIEHPSRRVAESMDGWNGLVMVPAGPNLGKTTFAVQAGVEVVEANTDAVLVFFSFEMSFDRMRDRLLSYLAGVAVKDIRAAGIPDHKFDSTRRKLEAFGDRIAIVSAEMVGRLGGTLDPREAFRPLQAIVEGLKRRTGCSRAFVVVDNLQQMTFDPPPGSPFESMERDRYAMEGFKALRDRLGDRDPVVVISETRKDDFNAPTLGSTLGTGRIVYAADHVLLLSSPAWPGFEDDEDDDERPGGKHQPKKRKAKIDKLFLDAVPEADRPFCSAVEVAGAKVRDGYRGVFKFVFKHPKSRFEVVAGQEARR
jgi:replicative DNA helicase